MLTSRTANDDTDPEAVYIIPTTPDGRLLAVAERRPGGTAFWSVPSARRRHPSSDPTAIARRMLAVLRIGYTDLRPLRESEPIDCLPAVFTVTLDWSDRTPQYLGDGHLQLHALPTDSDTLRSLDLRPRPIIELLFQALASTHAV